MSSLMRTFATRIYNYITMKKLLSMIFVLMPLMSMAKVGGSCGQNVTWSYESSTGTLTIKGQGAMKDYALDTTPWYSYRKNIKNVKIIGGVTKIGDCALSNCSSLIAIVIPYGIKNIGNFAFHKCTSLKKIDIPNSVKYIGNCAFSGSSALSSVTIPNSVVDIGEGAFYSCPNLKTIYSMMKEIYDDFCAEVFDDETYNNAILYVPKGQKAEYKSTILWGEFKNIREK